jgi:hypothetical protein
MPPVIRGILQALTGGLEAPPQQWADLENELLLESGTSAALRPGRILDSPGRRRMSAPTTTWRALIELLGMWRDKRRSIPKSPT